VLLLLPPTSHSSTLHLSQTWLAKAREESKWCSEEIQKAVQLGPVNGINGIHMMAFFGLIPAHFSEYSQILQENTQQKETVSPRADNGYYKFVHGLFLPQAVSTPIATSKYCPPRYDGYAGNKIFNYSCRL
jgi:hypothetical protein